MSRIDNLAEAVTAYMPEALRATRTPGAVVALADRDGNTWAEGFGGVPADAVMRGASWSKLHTMTALMRLVEAGAVDLDEPVQHHLGSVRLSNPLGRRRITVRDLACYESGLRTDLFDADYMIEFTRLGEYVRGVLAAGRGREYGGTGPLWTARVGDGFQYSSLGAALLGLVVENANAQELSYEQFMADTYGLLGMGSTWIGPPGSVPAATQTARAPGYARLGDLRVTSPDLPSRLYPSLGVLTTASDQARWLVAMLRDGDGVLSPQSVRTMLAPQIVRDFPGDWPVTKGLAVELRNQGRPEENFGHGSAYPWGWWGESRAYTATGVAVVVWQNVWDLIRYVQPGERNVIGLVPDFVERLMFGSARADARREAREADARPGAGGDSWRWSYALGLLIAERSGKLLGAGPVPERVTELMVAGAAGERQLHAEAFAEGVGAMNAVGPDAASVGAFFESGACRLDKWDLDLLALEAGASRAAWPCPMEAFAA